MKRLLIVWHSRTGAARAMADASARGASAETGVETVMLSADAAGAADLLAADGYLFACPENLAAMSGAMKEFFDRNYYPVLERLSGRPYAMLIAAGSDGTGAVRQMARITLGWRLKPIAEPIIVCTHAQAPEAIEAPKAVAEADLTRCQELGSALAAGLSMGVF
ncbi:MAG: flavodoxin family protein [Phenylobacterium sp.]|uniref:NAD(P)H-dependent oxidoreductase n=1 Tax=Phenylobacterium sp. TaxID=1871053 RepID=UPI00120AF74C|nr:NAD(P)H-dependent oxidoreductase [Phenylobacterium sp.]TAL33595.1 MAG: flavodoxin family protein [Phenylobacterium sp.]